MKKNVFMLITLAVLILPYSAAAQDDFRQFSNAEFHFSIKIPSAFSEFTIKSKDVETAAGVKVQKHFITSGHDALIIISALDMGFPPGDEQIMIDGLKFARMQYSASNKTLDEGQKRINGNFFLTGRYVVNQDGTDLYVDVYLSHISTFQFQIQVLAYTPQRLDSPDLQGTAHSFMYTGN